MLNRCRPSQRFEIIYSVYTNLYCRAYFCITLFFIYLNFMIHTLIMAVYAFNQSISLFVKHTDASSQVQIMTTYEIVWCDG